MLENSKQKTIITHIILIFMLIAMGLFLNVFPRIVSLYQPNHAYLLTNDQSLLYLIFYSIIVSVVLLTPYFLNNISSVVLLFGIITSYLIIIASAFYIDIFYLYDLVESTEQFNLFSQKINAYLMQEYWFYTFLSISLAASALFIRFFYKSTFKNTKLPIKSLAISIILLTPLFLVWPLEWINFRLFSLSNTVQFTYLPFYLIFLQNGVYALITLFAMTYVYQQREKYQLKLSWKRKFFNLAGLMSAVTLMIKFFLLLAPYFILARRIGQSASSIIYEYKSNVESELLATFPVIAVVIIILFCKKLLKQTLYNDVNDVSKTTGNFGTAAFATQQDLIKLNAYNNQNGIPIGTDSNNKMLYLPLCNKLTISPPGSGKTVASSMLALLTHNGPFLGLDVKGELWAVTARYRAEVFKRTVITIDPYNVTRSPDFAHGKSDLLLKTYRINPFDWIPEDKKQRDRILNTFAASFIINEGGMSTHFDENAKILIRGYIDYMMGLPKAQRNLATLYALMSENSETAQMTFDQMAQKEGRAGAAANQISRVGSDERGSILSTSYRQIDWMGDSNVQDILSESNFDLGEFLKGNMDIFVILPEDQVKEHSRLMRMMLSILMGMIVQANPSDLPKEKILFLLEELAQLGYCPDVEQCIEVLRARGVIVWTVFQTLSQIELFEKPDLFKGAPLKQIFTNDDTKTMEWIQTLGGKKTVLTKTISNNTGDSRQKMQVFGGSVSSGEGESVHETGVDLIQMNEIRELSKDEQFVFLHGAKPIKCKKARYFEQEIFLGKYDQNPLENRINVL